MAQLVSLNKIFLHKEILFLLLMIVSSFAVAQKCTVYSYEWSAPQSKNFQYFTLYGMPSLQSIQTAIVDAAEFLDQKGIICEIIEGPFADFAASKKIHYPIYGTLMP